MLFVHQARPQHANHPGSLASLSLAGLWWANKVLLGTNWVLSGRRPCLATSHAWCEAGWTGLTPMCSSRPCCLPGFGGCHSRGSSRAGRQIHPPDWPSSNQSAASYNAVVLDADRLTGARALRQQDLSAAIDKAQLAQLTVSAPDESTRAHLQLVQQPGAGAWLFARPSKVLGLHLDAAFFRVALRMRLRVPVASTDGYCPLCDGIADRYGDHARACPCGGDRTKRHNRLRGLMAARASAAGLSPEVEKQGLLPHRPEELGASESGRPSVSQRRPADVYLPSWGAHGPAALDLAATSGMRGSVLAASAADGASAAINYESRKCSHHLTEQLCAGQGLQFVPLVVEACGGGWGPAAMNTWRKLGALHAAHIGLSNSEGVQQLLQALAIAPAAGKCACRPPTHALFCRWPGCHGRPIAPFEPRVGLFRRLAPRLSWCWSRTAVVEGLWHLLVAFSLLPLSSQTGHGFFQLIFHPTPAWPSIRMPEHQCHFTFFPRAPRLLFMLAAISVSHAFGHREYLNIYIYIHVYTQLPRYDVHWHNVTNWFRLVHASILSEAKI